MPACAIVLDLDGFKEINDAFGHSCGDAALIAVADCLRREVGRQDLLARLGGDEFALLLPDATLAEARPIAERLRQAIEETEIVHGANRARVGASLGLAQAEAAGWSWDHLMTNCDQALYGVKREGGNRVGLSGRPERQPEIGLTMLALQSALSVSGESNTIV